MTLPTCPIIVALNISQAFDTVNIQESFYTNTMIKFIESYIK